MAEVALPEGGGFNDQTAAFAEGLRLIRRQELHWKAYARGRKNR